jgi:Ni,Fe-hydrogenase III small subunit/NAD-dependent dihydropyrimidine dehydrogenase PreA subunit
MLAAATRGLPEVDPTLCRIDGACAAACPTGAISLTPGAWTVDAGKCVFCGDCALACPNDAVRMSPRVELASRDRHRLVETTKLGAAEGAATAGGSAGPGATATAPSTATATAAAPTPAEARLQSWIARRLGRSLHIRHLDAGSCNGCDWEIAALLNPYHDIQRLGIDFVASPRHADLLLVTGVMTLNLEEAARRTYEAMPEPRVVVAVGACPISGGVFAPSPRARDGVAGTLPVDVFVPGCPPRPEAIIEAILMAVDRFGPEGRPGRGASAGASGAAGASGSGSGTLPPATQTGSVGS